MGTTKLVAGMMRTAVQDCIVKEMWRNPIARTSMSVTQQTDYFLGQNIADIAENARRAAALGRVVGED